MLNYLHVEGHRQTTQKGYTMIYNIVSVSENNEKNTCQIAIISFTDKVAVNEYMKSQKQLFSENVVYSDIEFDNEETIINSIAFKFSDGSEYTLNVRAMQAGDMLFVYEK